MMMLNYLTANSTRLVKNNPEKRYLPNYFTEQLQTRNIVLAREASRHVIQATSS